MPQPPVRAYVGLGANLGDSAATLRQVLAQLEATPGIAGVTASPFYRSAPVDATGPDFINAVAALDTVLAPLALLDVLQALEHEHGRLRPYRNAPRTLDLDLLLHGDAQLDHERLILPIPVCICAPSSCCRCATWRLTCRCTANRWMRGSARSTTSPSNGSRADHAHRGAPPAARQPLGVKAIMARSTSSTSGSPASLPRCWILCAEAARANVKCSIQGWSGRVR